MLVCACLCHSPLPLPEAEVMCYTFVDKLRRSVEVCSAGKQAQHSRGPGQLVQVDRLTDSTTLRMVQTGSSDIFARHVTRSLHEHGEKPSRTDSSRPDKVTFLDWNRDGSILASGDSKGEIKLWHVNPTGDVPPEEPKATLNDRSSEIAHLSWHPKVPQQLAAASADKIVRLWDTRQPQPSAKVSVTSNNFYVSWGPDGTQLLVTSKNNCNSVVDMRTQKILKQKTSQEELNQPAIHPSGQYVIQAAQGGWIKQLSWPDLDVMMPIKAHNNRVLTLIMDRSGRYFATSSSDSTAAVWECDSMLNVASHVNFDFCPFGLAFSPDLKILAIGGDEPTVKLNYTRTGEAAGEFENTGCTNADAVAMHPEHLVLAVGGHSIKDSSGKVQWLKVFAPKASKI